MVCQQEVGSNETEYTVGVFSDSENVKSITLKHQLGLGGMSVAVECFDIPEISLSAIKVAQLLDLKGSLNIQFREENGKYYIFEINPRISSTSVFRHLMGFQDAVW